MPYQHKDTKNSKPTKILLLILLVTFSYMIAEVLGGIYTNSLALMADAGHMLADVSAILISLAAFYISSKPATQKSTYGFQRAEVLAALFNGLLLLLSAFFIIKEAISRIMEPSEIKMEGMITIALGGLLVNLFCLYLVGKDKNENLNLKGAWLHILSDTLGSLAVIVSGGFIYFFGWLWFDPLSSIVICVLIILSAANLIFKTLSVLMEQIPPHINMEKLEAVMLNTPYVLGVHDLHVWSITIGNEALSAHVLINDKTKSDEILLELQKRIQEYTGIKHLTLQLESQCSDSNYC